MRWEAYDPLRRSCSLLPLDLKLSEFLVKPLLPVLLKVPLGRESGRSLTGGLRSDAIRGKWIVKSVSGPVPFFFKSLLYCRLWHCILGFDKIPYLGMENSCRIASWLALLSTNTAFFLAPWTSSVTGPGRPCSCGSCCLRTESKQRVMK